MPATISVVIPTAGRSSLRATLASVALQLRPGDEVLVVRSNAGDFGNAARQSLIERALGSHLAFIDDDDQLAPDALATMRRAAGEHPGRVVIFRMQYLDGRVLWAEPVLRARNVSSQMFLVPNVPGKLGRWDDADCAGLADHHFIARTVALQGEPVFREEIVAYISADRRASVRTVQRVLVPLRLKLAPRTRVRRLLRRR